MKTIQPVPAGSSKADGYRQIYAQLEQLLTGETDFLANAANMAALLYHTLPDLNWAGFYFTKGEALALGPFQGKPACTRIAFGEGVCGTAAARKETIIVPDVGKFDGHIACDTASKSEIAIPLLNWGRLVGVLDVDSPSLNRFDEDDHEGLESLAALYLSSLTTDDLPDFEAMASNTEA
ncbi:MAG TPA: GAF domain-containing protein [Bryobacteraceae bacterium]|nr:GAF domain-containing protein [Bryobacteraceae bacterium]